MIQRINGLGLTSAGRHDHDVIDDTRWDDIAHDLSFDVVSFVFGFRMHKLARYVQTIMSTIRGKAVVNPSQNIDKEKATWDPKANEAFIEACLEQITKGEHLGSSFTKVRWKGWDNIRNTVNAPNEWWETKQLENPLYGKFRYKGHPFAHQLTILFKNVVATRDFMWAPSSRILPSTFGGDVNDVYRPCLDGININMEEGSGDSDDVSVGATNEFGDININASQGTGSQAIGSQKSGEKHKRIDRTEKIGKKKLNASLKIAEVVSDIAKTCRSCIEDVSSASINEVVKELKTLPEVANDTELHTKCCNLMLFKPAREMFIALQGEDEKRPQDPMFRDCEVKIESDQQYWPFFKNTIGAIDGTHIPCIVSPAEQARFIGRKGTAHDARVFDHALTNANLNFPHPPPGKYYLVDAGYPTPMGYLGPYICERYHLPDFRRKSRFANDNEVFNFYHSSLRRNATMDSDFIRYEEEDILLDIDYNNHNETSFDQSQVLNIVSAPEMDNVQDYI
ncbi:hypothetical protein D0Y65_000519 [Glycine soja]|uniref:DDE Tnp4 domain-containing protein n=1 Tax=Glycine soja TaxID=3848 RepID=A0A445LZ62_GLYSO|nr:hypothetical protein D0Y65_000519 [Glycine soja]